MYPNYRAISLWKLFHGKGGLNSIMGFLQEQGLTIDVLVMDRHKQINKWIRESHLEVKHFYDSGMLLKVIK